MTDIGKPIRIVRVEPVELPKPLQPKPQTAPQREPDQQPELVPVRQG